MISLTATQYSILIYLKENDKTKILMSCPVSVLAEQCEISEAAAYRAIDVLLGCNFIALGVQVGNKRTYYITDDGLEHLYLASGEK